MKVVMVHDCAYVGYELRRELIKRGLEVEHVLFSGWSHAATLKMVMKLRKTKCDFVHAHYLRSSAYASFLSGKPYVIHCHGSDIRGGISWLKRKCLKKAKSILVSTPDLLRILPSATWLPNPVDVERFRPLREHDGNKILYFPQWYEDKSRELKEICEKLGYNLTVPKAYSVPYEDMHVFLNDFDIFIDRFSIRSYSKTALEAMACGLSVVGYDFDMETALNGLIRDSERSKRREWQNRHIVPNHNVTKVVNQLLEIYSQLR